VTVTTELEIEVPIAAFHNAVRAVLPHADRPKLGSDPTDQPLARVRLVAAATELHLMATNGRTSALAAVPIVDGSDSRGIRFAVEDGPYVADIHPKMLRQLRDGVTAAKVEGELTGDARLFFTAPTPDGDGAGRITASDVGGLWVGSETTRTLLPLVDRFPDIAGLLSQALGAAEGTYKPMVVDGLDLGAFQAASRAYDAPLHAEPVGSADQRGWIVLCGTDFAGSISGGHHDDDSLKRRSRWRMKHMARLGLGGDLASVG